MLKKETIAITLLTVRSIKLWTTLNQQVRIYPILFCMHLLSVEQVRDSLKELNLINQKTKPKY